MADVKIKVKDREGVVHELEAPTDMNMNLMEICKAYELPVKGTWGGMAMCASCHCYVESNLELQEANDDEEDMLDQAFFVEDNSRLGCQIFVKDSLDGLVIRLADESEWIKDLKTKKNEAVSKPEMVFLYLFVRVFRIKNVSYNLIIRWMNTNFKDYIQHQNWLLPPSIEELIPADHPVRIVNGVVEQLDLDLLIAEYSKEWKTSYHTKMILKVMVYAYMDNTYSSRKIE